MRYHGRRIGRLGRLPRGCERRHETRPVQDDLHHRAPPAWSAATRSRRPCSGATASGPWSAPSSDTRWLDQLGRREGRRRPGRSRGPPRGRRRGRLGLQLRGQGGRLGHPGGVPPAQRRGAPAPARRRRRRQGRAVRPRQLARRLRGPRPLRHRRDRAARPPNSLDAYTRSKTEAEALALRVSSTSAGCPLAIVRPGFIYGERDRTVLPKLLHSTSGAGRFAYFGSGDQVLNCIYVKNLVHGIFLAAEVPEAVGEVFNLTDGEPVSKKQFVGRVAELAGLKPPRRKIPLWLAWTLAVLMERRAKRREVDRAAAGQQGPLQVPRPEPRLLDREGPPRARLSASVHDRARDRRAMAEHRPADSRRAGRRGRTAEIRSDPLTTTPTNRRDHR